MTDATIATAARASSVSAAVQRPHETMAVFVLEQRASVRVTPEGVLEVGGILPCAELLGPRERRRRCRQPSAAGARYLSPPRRLAARAARARCASICAISWTGFGRGVAPVAISPAAA